MLLGRLDLAIFASFGAFTGIYGTGEPHGVRFALQLRAGCSCCFEVRDSVSSRHGMAYLAEA